MSHKFKNYPSCHVHPQSLDTGCLPESFIKRELELETGHFCETDHGSLAGIRIFDKLAKKNGLIFTPGLEGYLRDDKCDILLSHGYSQDDIKKYSKYYHLTIHYLDQDAYETGVRLLSKAGNRAEKHGSETKPLFDWSDIEEMGAKNTIMTSSCLGGIVAVHLKDHQRPDIAEAYYKRVMDLCKPGNFYTEVSPHVCDRRTDSIVVVKFTDGTEEVFRTSKKLMTSDGEEYANKLASAWSRKKTPLKDPKEIKLISVMDNRKWVERPVEQQKVILEIRAEEKETMNECTPFAPNGDVQKGANQFVIDLAKKYNVPVIIGDDSHFAYPEQKIVQDIRLQTSGGWKFSTSNYRLSSEEAYERFRGTLGLTPSEFETWIGNCKDWSQRFKDFKFKDNHSLPTSFFPQDTLKYTLDLIEKHGRVDWKDPVYTARLKSELKLLHKNGKIDLLPYFFPIEDLDSWYENVQKELAGPGRGSSAGLLLMYYLGITHVDPIKYGLSQDRFLTLDRIEQGKLPDVDSDYPNRDPIIDSENGYLKKKYGDHFVQVSTATTLKLRSAALDVARVLCGSVPEEISKLTSQFINAPQGVTDAKHVFGYVGSDDEMVPGTSEPGHSGTDQKLLEYIEKYPKHWEIVKECLGLQRAQGRHASAFLITNRPVQEFIPTMDVSKVRVTQYTAESCETSGAVKYDLLGVEALNDLDVALKIIRERQGIAYEDKIIEGKRVPGVRILPLKGELYDIYDLPTDQNVYKDICEGKTETVFQLDTPSVRGWLKHFNFVKENGNRGLDSIESLAALTALDRPGPLDYFVKDEEGRSLHNMLVEYAQRVQGKPGIGRFAILDELLPETQGIMCFQEGLGKVFREVGGTTGIQAENFRTHTSKKQRMEVIKDKAIFMPGAIAKLGEEKAEELWESMETFANYSFCKAHAVSYVTTSYACAFLKHHYPLEWWTAVLRNASKNEVDSKFWPYCSHLILLPDIDKSGEEFQIEGDKIRAPLRLLHGIGPKAHDQLLRGRPYKGIEDVCDFIQLYKKENGTEERAATSALNRGVMYRLIISGSLDSLFPTGLTTGEKLQAYEKSVHVSSGKGRNPKPVSEYFLNLNEFQEFQYKKQVLPAYTANLLEIFNRLKVLPELHKNENNKWAFTYKNEELLVIQGDKLDVFEQSGGYIPGNFKLAIPVSVLEDTRRIYQKNGRGNEMQKLILDMNGTRREFIRWPNKAGKLPESVGKNQTGSLAMAIIGRWSEEKPFSIEDLVIVQEPLKANSEDK